MRNAIKYTNARTRPAFLPSARNRHAYRHLRHGDWHVGGELPQIFEAFQRLDSNRSDGLGLGLFIVRRAVELLGHRIEVSSRVGRGSRFSVLAEAQL